MLKAIGDFIRLELIEIIEWIDETSNTIIHKFDDRDREIKMGAQLIVRESQIAYFLNEGKMADVFYPGTYTLTTENIPVLSTLRGWKYGFQSPFKADVYFFSTKQFFDIKWGTSTPILMRDPELGAVRLRAYGNFSFRIEYAPAFFTEVAGTSSTITTEIITEHLKGVAISVFANTLSNAQIPALYLSTKYTELGKLTLEASQQRFSRIGVSLTGFVVESIALPQEVEKHVDKLGSMNIVGDLDRYTKFQIADSIPAAASAEGGIAGLGAGLAVGQQIAKSMMESTASAVGKYCPKCGTGLPTDAVFCIKCGEKQ